MPLALILSSHVAGSRVGGFPQALVLGAHGVDPVLVPTVLFGRRPSPAGPPGGAAVEPTVFQGMLEGVRAHGLFGLADAVITGYFAHPDQVAAAAETIDAVRAADRAGAWNPHPLIVVDPILGDAPDGLYVRPDVAEALRRELLPRADLLTPNLWELGWLTDSAPTTVEAITAAARTLGKPTLVTSTPGDSADDIAALWVDGAEVRRFRHRHYAGVPNGTGDLVAATLAAALINRRPAAQAAEIAIRAAAEAVAAAHAWSAPELPLVALGARLLEPTAEVWVEDFGPERP